VYSRLIDDHTIEELASFFEFSRDMLGILTVEGQFHRVNRAWEEGLGYGSNDLVGRSIFDLAQPNDRAETTRKFDTVVRRGETVIFTNRCSAKNGRERWIQWNLTPAPGEPHIYACVRDVTKHVTADEELTRANELLTAILLSAPLAMWASDLEGRIQFWNEQAEETLGWTADEVLTGQPPQVLPGSRVADNFGERLTGLEVPWRRKDGSLRHLRIWTAPLHERSGRQCGTLGMIVDGTEQKRHDEQKLEENARQTQKMEAIGRLAGGVAHDFNNLLTVILCYTTILNNQLGQEHPYRDTVGTILRAGQQATSLTRQLLAYSRKQLTQPRVLSLNELVQQMRDMLQRLIGEDIDLAVTFDSSPCQVKADESQLSQVIMNLVVNARDAMPTGGKLAIETRFVAQENIGFRGGRPGCCYAVLVVRDTGHGMDPDTIAHIFEPFFTTKEACKGTGLGLATVYGIVQQHGGWIDVSSELNSGTVFSVFLPAFDGSAAQDVLPLEDTALTRTGTILLVEDQLDIRVVAREILSEAGHRVLSAANGRAALELAENHQGAIDLLITDVVMPEMSGPELATQISRSRPDLTVLYVSGYSDHALLKHVAVEQGTAFLQKPFLPDALLGKVSGLFRLRDVQERLA